MKIIFSPVAYQDLQRLYTFLKEATPSSLALAAERLKKAFGTLEQFPVAGYALGSPLTEIRELLVPFGKGNFVIRYRLKEEVINVLHLWHSREDRESAED